MNRRHHLLARCCDTTVPLCCPFRIAGQVEFLDRPYDNRRVYEGAPVGTEISPAVRACNSVGGVCRNDVVTYRLSGADSLLFNIDRITGTVCMGKTGNASKSKVRSQGVPSCSPPPNSLSGKRFRKQITNILRNFIRKGSLFWPSPPLIKVLNFLLPPTDKSWSRPYIH